MLIEAPGVYPGIPDHVYHADALCPEPSLSSSGARDLMSGDPPAIFWHKRQHPKAPSDPLVFGSAAHEWLLEGERWPKRHFVLPEDHNARTKDGKVLVAEMEGAGLRVITADQFAQIKGMKDALEAHPYAMAAFQNGVAESSLYWVDPHTGIWCRCRPDYMPGAGRIYADYKTTLSVRDDELQRAIKNYGYHMQASWYSDGIRQLGLAEHPIMLFVFQEKAPPYLVRCVTIGEQSLGWAETQNHKARSIFASCLRSGSWPGYEEDIQTIELPSYELGRLHKLSEAGRFDTQDMGIAA